MNHLRPAAVLAGLLLLIGAVGFSGCAKNSPASSPSPAPTSSDSRPTVNVAAIKGPTAVGMADLMSENDAGTTKNNYNFILAETPDEVVGKISSGEVNIASISTNLAATLYQKTNQKVKILAANTKGVLSMLENGGSIHTVADLKGKTIYTFGQGANPEYVLRYVLGQNGLDPDKDVTIQFVADSDTLVAAIAAGTATVAMVPEPAASAAIAKTPGLRVAFSMNSAWDALNNGSGLLMGCVIVRSDYLAANPGAVTDFLSEYEQSINSGLSDVDNTASLCVKYSIIPTEALAKAAIPGCNLTFLTGAGMKQELQGYLQVLYDAAPASVGGKLPDDGFYYS